MIDDIPQFVTAPTSGGQNHVTAQNRISTYYLNVDFAHKRATQRLADGEPLADIVRELRDTYRRNWRNAMRATC